MIDTCIFGEGSNIKHSSKIKDWEYKKPESNGDSIAKKQKEYHIHRGGFNKYCQVLKEE